MKSWIFPIVFSNDPDIEAEKEKKPIPTEFTIVLIPF